MHEKCGHLMVNGFIFFKKVKLKYKTEKKILGGHL
jgi:hypothetical protein